MLLAYLRTRHFINTIYQRRSLGERAAVGMSGYHYRRRWYALVVVDGAGVVRAAEHMCTGNQRGGVRNLFVRFRADDAYVGQSPEGLVEMLHSAHAERVGERREGKGAVVRAGGCVHCAYLNALGIIMGDEWAAKHDVHTRAGTAPAPACNSSARGESGSEMADGDAGAGKRTRRDSLWDMPGFLVAPDVNRQLMKI